LLFKESSPIIEIRRGQVLQSRPIAIIKAVAHAAFIKAERAFFYEGPPQHSAPG